MSLTLNTAATLRHLALRPNLLPESERQPFEKAEEAGEQLKEALDTFYPNLDESANDAAKNEPGVIRYRTSKNEHIQVTFEGDSQEGQYLQEWVGGGFILSRFDADSIENYQVGGHGAHHLHIDRHDPSKSFVEVAPQGYNFFGQESAPAKPAEMPANAVKLESGLEYGMLREGDASEQADSGERVAVHYSGWLQDGTPFDSSHNRGKPFEFNLGHRQVIQGWEQGVEGMKAGEKRLLQIPANLAYGERARPGIPANSPLTFEVELLATSGELVAPK